MSRNCSICRQSFAPKSIAHMICSDECRTVSRGAAWRAIRDYVREYYGDKCRDCGHIGCDIHHIIPVAVAGMAAHVFENLIPLCRPCHIAEHKAMKEVAH